MRRFTAIGLIAGSLLLAAPATQAQAQDAPVQYKKKTVIDFNDVTLEGELTKPEGAYVLDRTKAKFQTLIRLRPDFLDELKTSVDNL